MEGVYNESLKITRTGTQTGRITLKNHNNQAVTINSGSTKETLIASGRISYYTLDGLRFISAFTPSGQGAFSLNFQGNIWDGETTKDGGNNNIIVKNCYVEGAILFYGHYNLVENCELNGKGVWANGIQDRFGPSHNNVYRKNKIYGYTFRGIWTMQYTDNILIEENTTYNNKMMGIDCDGAGNYVYRCFVKNNTIYDISGEGVGILMENSFDSTIENNTIYNVKDGIRVINYGKTGNYDPNFHANGEYRHKDLNMIISSNTIRNTRNNGIICNSAAGVKVTNNNFSLTNTENKAWFGAIGLSRNGDFYCRNWTMTNNTMNQVQIAYWFEYGTYTIPAGTYEGLNIDVPTDLGSMVLDNNRYDYSSTASKYHYKISSSRTNVSLEQNRTLTQMKQTGYELNSSTSDNQTQPTSSPTNTSIPSSTATPLPTPTPVPGDCNADGRVNETDYTIWLNYYNQTVNNGPLSGDFNKNNKVDGVDYVIWLNNFTL